MSFLVNPKIAALALHHDDDEAYVGDMTTPLKYSLTNNEFRNIEHRILDVIFEALNLNGASMREVKEADKLALIVEAVRLYGAECVRHWSLDLTIESAFVEFEKRRAIAEWSLSSKGALKRYRPILDILPMSPAACRNLFLERHGELNDGARCVNASPSHALPSSTVFSAAGEVLILAAAT
jgi:hypothetical protein